MKNVTAPAKTFVRHRVPPLTNSYQKAHKNYVLVSGLLAAWQLIGISIETKNKWGVTLKSPGAVPLILFSMVIYFGYKVTVEWMQCDDMRRVHPAAKLDFRIAHLIALSAVLITLVQYVWRIQIVDSISKHAIIVETPFFLGLLVSLPTLSFVIRNMRTLKWWVFVLSATLLLAMAVLGIFMWKTTTHDLFVQILIAGVSVSATIAVLPSILNQLSEFLDGLVLGATKGAIEVLKIFLRR